MSKMSNIDLIIKDLFRYIVITFIAAVIGFLIYVQEYRESKNEINNIETTLQTQMNYIHQLEADVDNLYRVVE